MNDKRRLPRKRPGVPLQVTDTMTGMVIGHLGDASLEGMLLVADTPITESALYQVVFHLPDSHGRLFRVEAGIHESWSEQGRTAGRTWAGFRFIDIDPDGEAALRAWLKLGPEAAR